MFFRTKKTGKYTYLQIVENKRSKSGDKVCQKLLANLGPLKEIHESGKLEKLLNSGLEFLARLNAQQNNKTKKTRKGKGGRHENK